MIWVLGAAVVFLGWAVYMHHLTIETAYYVVRSEQRRVRLLTEEQGKLIARVRALEPGNE